MSNPCGLERIIETEKSCAKPNARISLVSVPLIFVGVDSTFHAAKSSARVLFKAAKLSFEDVEIGTSTLGAGGVALFSGIEAILMAEGGGGATEGASSGTSIVGATPGIVSLVIATASTSGVSMFAGML